jgi:hypothetical protein
LGVFIAGLRFHRGDAEARRKPKSVHHRGHGGTRREASLYCLRGVKEKPRAWLARPLSKWQAECERQSNGQRPVNGHPQCYVRSLGGVSKMSESANEGFILQRGATPGEAVQLLTQRFPELSHLFGSATDPELPQPFYAYERLAEQIEARRK